MLHHQRTIPGTRAKCPLRLVHLSRYLTGTNGPCATQPPPMEPPKGTRRPAPRGGRLDHPAPMIERNFLATLAGILNNSLPAAPL